MHNKRIHLSLLVIATVLLIAWGMGRSHATWQTPTNSKGVLVNREFYIHKICDAGNLIYASASGGGYVIQVLPGKC